jgi:LuxR family maltose regulon positive regulatory protein
LKALSAEWKERRGPLSVYIQLLLAAFNEPHRSSRDAQHPALVEPLSARELEVLRLIAQGQSNQEIAESLVVALSTVKKHINGVYGKLGVRSRTQALARARELGLL